MILHAHNVSNPPGPLHWWAVHRESLTPLRIHLDANRLAIDVFPHPPASPVFMSYPDADASPAALAAQVLADVRAHFSPHISLIKTRIAQREKIQVPEYLLAWDINGDHPTLCRTQDPHITSEAGYNGDPTILNGIGTFRTLTDIPVDGWTYWWDDCQQAFESLSETLATAHAKRLDIPTP